MVFLPGIQDLSFDSSSSISSPIFLISPEAKVQLKTPIKALFGMPCMGAAHFPTLLVVIYPEGGEMGDATQHPRKKASWMTTKTSGRSVSSNQPQGAI